MGDKSGDEEDTDKAKVVRPFHQRFNIEVDVEETRKRFLNRVRNSISPWLIGAAKYGRIDEVDILLAVANSLGKRYDPNFDFDDYVGNDFYSCLKALEAVHQALPETLKQEFDEILQEYAILQSETDLGIRWADGVFLPSGAKLLDETLVDENLKWLADLKYANVLAPFEKGLRHFLEAHREPEKLADTVTDMYEALEKMARITLGNNKNLKANAEKFVSRLNLSNHYSEMLKRYNDYAHEYRHAVEEGRQREPPRPEEVEAFVYATGLYIRLAVQRLAAEQS